MERCQVCENYKISQKGEIYCEVKAKEEKEDCPCWEIMKAEIDIRN